VSTRTRCAIVHVRGRRRTESLPRRSIVRARGGAYLESGAPYLQRGRGDSRAACTVAASARVTRSAKRGRLRRRWFPRSLARASPSARGRGAAVSHRFIRAQLRASGRHHGGARLLARRGCGRHGRRSAGSSGGRVADGREVARGVRRCLRRPAQTGRRKLVQVADGACFLSTLCRDDPDRRAARRRRLPFDESARRADPGSLAGNASLRARDGGLGRFQANPDPLRSFTIGPPGSRARRSTRYVG
jgi:hypothetical protein